MIQNDCREQESSWWGSLFNQMSQFAVKEANKAIFSDWIVSLLLAFVYAVPGISSSLFQKYPQHPLLISLSCALKVRIVIT